ncbi:uncharacterized protein LOC125067200 isoform X3 [Vanessa atalanta]|uniref:uncharacterized protein LOC125067200 isoform X3 n=1 Tax=Vanessa atalanta TaxID=42275 RepID=UPI001FCE1905|nr:uncharacterized protein LOC125067200 isoform X3 [Vanessa atalanta]
MQICQRIKYRGGPMAVAKRTPHGAATGISFSTCIIHLPRIHKTHSKQELAAHEFPKITASFHRQSHTKRKYAHEDAPGFHIYHFTAAHL